MQKTIAVLAGDGIGPEVMAEAIKVLQAVADIYQHTFILQEALVGGAAFDEYGSHLPASTLAVCQKADAILFGSVGGPINSGHNPKWQNCEKNSILALRKALQFSTNLRPAYYYRELAAICPLNEKLARLGFDILMFVNYWVIYILASTSNL